MKSNFLIASLLIAFIGNAQFNSNAPWRNSNSQGRQEEQTINQLVDEFEQYWSTHDWRKKGSGFKPFKRWEYHWSNNVNEQGYLITPQELWDAWREKNIAKANHKSTMAVPPSNWEPIGPTQNAQPNSTMARGRVNIVHVDPSNPNTIYFGTPGGGIWKSTDAGATWTPMSDYLPQLGVSGIAVDYSDSNIIYIATGDKDASDTYSVGVLKSTDGGVTWNTTGLTFTNTNSFAGDIVIHPTNNQILWCATSVGIYKTTNAGTSWTMVQAGDFSQGSLRLKPNDPTTIYASGYTGSGTSGFYRFYKSTNSGDSFTTSTLLGMPNTQSLAGRMILDVTPANSNYVYALIAKGNNSFQGIYKSTNSGANFTKVSNTTNILESSQAWYDLAFAASPTNAEEVYTGCLNVWKSTNGGASSTKINNWSTYNATFTHADIHYLGFHGNKLYCGSDGGIYMSDNNAASFSDLTGEAQIGQFYKISVAKQSANNIAGGLQDNGGFAYNNNTWRGYHGGDGMDNAINPLNPNQYYGFIYYGQNMYISNDAGVSLSSAVSGPSGEQGDWVTPMSMNSQGELFAGFTKLYKLVNNAWVQQSTTIGSGNIICIAIDPMNDNNMYVSLKNSGNLYKSTDKGITFNLVYTASTPIESIDVHSSNSNIVYLTTKYTYGQVLVSNNGGTTFTDITNGIPNIGKRIIVHQGRNSLNPIYVGTTLGVYYKDDTMSAFEPFDTNLPNVDVRDLEINLEDSKLIAGTYGRGVWQTDIPVEVPNNDVKLENISSPINVSCGSVTPSIQVKNNGQNAITTVQVDYTVDGTPYNQVWNGSIASGNSQVIALPTLALSRGTHTIDITATIANDAYPDNNNLVNTFYINDAGTIGQVNSFTSSPNDELISYIEGTNGNLWQIGITTGTISSGSNSVCATNLSGNYPNLSKAYLVSQCYDLSFASNPQIKFDMKYDLEQDWDITYVEYSTDFGTTWSVLGQMGPNWYNSNRTEFTTGNDCFNCPGAQWTGTNTTQTNYFYSLNSLVGQANVIFRIVFHSDEAVNQAGVYIDNFVIEGTLSTSDFNSNTVMVYPNPSKGVFNISLGNKIPEKVEVYDVTGKLVLSNHKLNVSNFETSIDLSAASQGIYFVKVSSEGKNVVKRIVKE